MTCLRENLKGADLLIGYLEGTLSAEERAALDQHASACAECRGLLAAQEMLGDDDVPEVSADFDARLYARLQQEQQQQWWRRFLWRPAVPLAAAAAILAVTLWVRPVAPPQVDEPKSAMVDRVEIEQLEQALDDVELLMPVNKTPEVL
jgi:anti-sigma-K factor RskA